MQRVQKLLSNYGYCSRRKAEDLIEDGKVKVNGKTITLGDKATEEDKITVDGKLVQAEKKVYLMFNKPVKCVTALRDEQHKTVMDYLFSKERVFPIGRLDFNTSGLLLLTNDGDFANQIMHPRYEIKKTYLVKIDRPITGKDIRQLETGVMLDDGKTSPAKVKVIEDQLIELSIHEGKNRIVRRMLGAIDIQIAHLIRIRVGKLALGSLKTGKSRPLTKKEREMVFKK